MPCYWAGPDGDVHLWLLIMSGQQCLIFETADDYRAGSKCLHRHGRAVRAQPIAKRQSLVTIEERLEVEDMPIAI